MSFIRKSGLPIVIILVALVVMVVLIMNKPKPVIKPVAEKAFLVETQPVTVTDITYSISSQGTVSPKVKSALTPQVSGIVERVSDVFVNGGMFTTGDILVQLEQADRQTELQLAQAELARAQAAYELELARGKVAAEEWRSVAQGDANNRAIPQLGLRKPQLDSEKANLAAARANLARAERNLTRTVIRAPYDGMVLQKNVDVGQFVTTGMVLAEIAATDIGEVRLPLTDNDLAYLDLSASEPDNVILRGNVGGRPTQWLATLTRDEGVLNSQNRVIYAIAQVTDPYVRNPQSSHAVLRFGSFVRADITGASVPNMVVLPRNLVRLDGTVLLVDENKRIEIRDVEVQRAAADDIYISAGLSPGDQIVTSAVPNAYDQMPVRLPSDVDADAADDASEPTAMQE
jgi:RND family efflux transporter MFP subunit